MDIKRPKRWENYAGFWIVLFVAVGALVFTLNHFRNVRRALAQAREGAPMYIHDEP